MPQVSTIYRSSAIVNQLGFEVIECPSPMANGTTDISFRIYCSACLANLGSVVTVYDALEDGHFFESRTQSAQYAYELLRRQGNVLGTMHATQMAKKELPFPQNVDFMQVPPVFENVEPFPSSDIKKIDPPPDLNFVTFL